MTVAATGPDGAVSARLRALPPVAMVIVGFGGATSLALTVALRAPLATMVLGLIAFGVLHNVLELRYVAGRFGAVLRGPLLWTLLGLVTGIVVCRLLALRTPEILLAYGVLAAGIRHAAPRRLLPWALGGLALAAAASLSWPTYHFVVLAHLHNIVPLFFLWEWSKRLTGRDRTIFRTTQVCWILVVPALLLAGVFDELIVAGPSAVAAFAGTPAAIAAPVVPAGFAGLDVGLRFLATFAFLQTMHYVVWVGFLPRFAPDASARFEERVGWLRGWRAWALGLGAAAVLAVLLWLDYAQGRTIYQAFASYHAYLEFPVLLALLFGRRGRPA
jgi:hypothetical protein